MFLVQWLYRKKSCFFFKKERKENATNSIWIFNYFGSAFNAFTYIFYMHILGYQLL